MVDVEWAMENLDRIPQSEDQFQFDIAAELGDLYGNERIRVEWQPETGNNTDIGVRRNEVTVPIELKFIRSEASIHDKRFGESYRLASNHDTNRSHYNIVKDIKRVEKVVSDQGGYGYFILLTNLPSYWSGTSQTALHDEFRVHEGRTLEGTLRWTEHRSWMKQGGRDQPIELAGEYEMDWEDFSYRNDLEVEGSPDFRYLPLRVEHA